MSIYTQRRQSRRWVLKKGFIDRFPIPHPARWVSKKGISLTISHSTPCAGFAGAGCGMGRRAFSLPTPHRGVGSDEDQVWAKKCKSNYQQRNEQERNSKFSSTKFDKFCKM